MLSLLALLASTAALSQAVSAGQQAGAPGAPGGPVGSAQSPTTRASMTQTGVTPPRGSSLATIVTPGVTIHSVTVGGGPGGALGIDTTQTAPTFQISITDPLGTGYDESFLVQIPPAASFPAPVLVAFHAYGVSEKDITANTTYPEECAERGWFLLAPLGATQVSYSSLESQAHIEYVLGLLSTLFAGQVDMDRIYGVGFSMGGGAMLNYAARHLDPAKPMFAGLVNHTGSVAHIDTYANEPEAQWIFEHWFGGVPAGNEFQYLRSSMFDFDPVSLAVDQSTDLVRNLTHVPVRSAYSNLDPLKYLLKQTDVFHDQLQLRGGTSQLITLFGFGHKWSNLDEKLTCDWLAMKTLALPTAAETLADHDGTYFHFDVTQDAGGAFTPFTWDGDAVLNRLTVSETANLTALRADTASLGLDTAAALSVVTSTADGLADTIVLSGYDTQPGTIERDGSRASGWMWSFDAGAGELSLLEFDGATPHTWLIIP